MWNISDKEFYLRTKCALREFDYDSLELLRKLMAGELDIGKYILLMQDLCDERNDKIEKLVRGNQTEEEG